MKKLLALSFFALVGFATHVAAQGFVPIAPIPDLTQGVVANSAGLATFFNNLYKYLIGFAAMLAFIEIVWGGLQISTQDSVSKQGEGRERITQAVLGLILVLSPVLVFSIVNPSILNLSLNLPELKTTSGTPARTGGGTQTPTIDAATGCSVTSTSGALQIASCPSTSAAQTFVGSCTGKGILLPVTSGGSESCQIVNGQQVCTTNQMIPAACEQSLSGTFVVINLGQTISLSTILQPVSSNAAAYTGFAASCAQSKGTLCGSRDFSATACPSTVNITLKSGQSGKCYNVTSLYCGSRYCSTQGGSILPTQ